MRALFKARRPVAYWLAISWLALIAGLGLLGPSLPLPYSSSTADLLAIATPPSAPHYLGTDALGRDVLAGLVAGARRLVSISLPATFLAAALGAVLGGAAGFWGNTRLRLPVAAAGGLLAAGWWALALPGQLLALLLALGSSLWLSLLLWQKTPRRQPTIALPVDSLVLGAGTLLGAVPRLIMLVALAAGPPFTTYQLLGLLVVVAWPEPARLVRAEMLRVRVQPFIEAAWASGLPPGRIWWHHALPAASQSLRSLVPLSLAGLIGLESSLAFLGIGQAPDAVSWGSLLAAARQEPSAWWVAAVPGLALLLTLLALQQVATAAKNR